MIATNNGRDMLLERGTAVREARNTGARYAEVAARLTDLVVFHMDRALGC